MIIENQNIKLRENWMKHKVIDIHLHIGGIGNSSPCKMSKKFLTSPAFLNYETWVSRKSVGRLAEAFTKSEIIHC